MKYLLPCEQCGEKQPIDASQAGEQLICTCGARLEVPSLRVIRGLETVGDTAAARRSGWNPLRGMLFALGLLIAAVSLGFAGVAAIAWLRTEVPEPPAENLEMALTMIDGLDASGSWDAWVDLRDNGLGPYRPPVSYLVLEAKNRMLRIVLAGLIAFAVGIVTAAAAFAPAKQAKPRRR
jgi:hypothetical protein